MVYTIGIVNLLCCKYVMLQEQVHFTVLDFFLILHQSKVSIVMLTFNNLVMQFNCSRFIYDCNKKNSLQPNPQLIDIDTTLTKYIDKTFFFKMAKDRFHKVSSYNQYYVKYIKALQISKIVPPPVLF